MDFVVLRTLYKIVPDPIVTRMRRWARAYLPASMKSRLKRMDQRARGDVSHRLIERQDAVFSVFEQKLEQLESMVFRKLDALEEQMYRRDADLIARQDHVLALFEQRLEQIERSAFDQIRQWQNDPLLTDEQYVRMQENYHDGQKKRAVYGRLIDKWIPIGGRVLDIGCGDGSLMEQMLEHGCEPIGVDTNTAAVDACLAKKLKVSEVDGLAYLTSQPTASFDAVTCLHVVEHLPNTTLAELVREVHRVLRPGGVFVFETPKIASIYDFTQYYYIDPTHKQPRHHDLLRFLCTDAGFADVAVEDVPTGEESSKLDLDLGSAERDDRARGSMIEPKSIEAARSNGTGNDVEPASVGVLEARETGVEKRLGELERRVRSNFEELHSWLFVARDVRLIATKEAAGPGNDASAPGGSDA